MRKAIQKQPGATDNQIIVHEIGNPFCLCEMQDGSLQLLPAVSIQFTEPPKPGMDIRTTIAAMAMQGSIASGSVSKHIIIMDAVKFADSLLKELKSKPQE